MMSNPKVVVIKNASANLVRLAGSGIVALLLPSFLVRRLSTDAYGAWALLLQWTILVGFLDFGVQTAVARFVAHANEVQDAKQRDGIASTALALLMGAAVLGFGLVVLAAWQLPHIFHGIPSDLHRGTQIALLLMGGSCALGLPVTVVHAMFIGLQRNEIPAAVMLFNRFTIAALVLVTVWKHWGLAAMGAAVATANALSYIGAYFAWRKWAPQIQIRLSLVSRRCLRQIAAYCAAVTVWLVAMLMVSGLDLTIVGIFDYPATAYYAVAATLTNFVAQAQNAIFAALLPASAVLAARGDSQRLGNVLVSSTRYGMLILLAMAVPLILAENFILRVWVGPAYAANAVFIFEVLLVANVIRLCALPYATLLLGTGQQQKVILSPLVEGIINLFASVAGAYLFGAIGVAFGTLAGSFVSVGFHLLYNMPRTSLIAIDRSLLLRQGLLRPLLCAVPLALIWLFRAAVPTLATWALLALIPAALMGTAILFWNYGLVAYERHKLGQALRIS